MSAPPNPGLVSGGGERPPHRPDSGEYDLHKPKWRRKR